MFKRTIENWKKEKSTKLKNLKELYSRNEKDWGDDNNIPTFFLCMNSEWIFGLLGFSKILVVFSKVFLQPYKVCLRYVPDVFSRQHFLKKMQILRIFFVKYFAIFGECADCRNRMGLIDLTYQKNVFNSNCHFIVPTTNFFILWRFNIINFFDQFFRPTIKGTIFRMTLSRPVTFPTNHYQADHHEIQKSIIMCLINLFTVNLGHSAC